MLEGETRAGFRNVANDALDRGAAVVVVERALEKRSLPDSDFSFFGHVNYASSINEKGCVQTLGAQKLRNY